MQARNLTGHRGYDLINKDAHINEKRPTTATVGGNIRDSRTKLSSCYRCRLVGVKDAEICKEGKWRQVQCTDKRCIYNRNNNFCRSKKYGHLTLSVVLYIAISKFLQRAMLPTTMTTNNRAEKNCTYRACVMPFLHIDIVPPDLSSEVVN